jgi:hypothetical protein
MNTSPAIAEALIEARQRDRLARALAASAARSVREAEQARRLRGETSDRRGHRLPSVGRCLPHHRGGLHLGLSSPPQFGNTTLALIGQGQSLEVSGADRQ